MYLYQYVLLAGFTCLLFNKETRFASMVFLFGWAVYLTMFIDAESTHKYMACATIEASIAYALNNKYRIVSYIGYSLIFVNIYGLILIKIKMLPVSYDIIYAILSVLQITFLVARVNLNGIYRLPEQCWLVRLVNYDSCKTRAIMYKSKTTKEANRWAKK